MADPRFFDVAGPFRADQLAALSGAVIGGAASVDRELIDVAPLDLAEPAHVSFLANPRYVDALALTRAGAVFIAPAMVDRAPPGLTLLIAKDPYMAFAKAALAFHPPRRAVPGIAATAVIAPDAVLGPDIEVGPYAVVESRAEIGAGSVLGPHAVIGAGAVLGEACRIGAHVTLSHCLIGSRVTVFPGARIGQDGFGFASGAEGHVKIPQLGRVIIGDDVEIGANTTIDRGAGPDTVIGSGCMIDNLVQIGHNVVVGTGCILVSQTGISGSTRLGDRVVTGGQVGLAGHLRIGAGAQFAAQSGVAQDVPAGARMGGSPAVPMTQWLRQVVALARLARRKGE